MGKNDGWALGGSSVGWSMADNLFLTFKYKLLPSRHQHEMLTVPKKGFGIEARGLLARLKGDAE